MRSARVVALEPLPPTTRSSFALRRDRLGLAMNCLSVLNLVTMPMKAYLSEYWPWAAPPVVPDLPSNYTLFNEMALAANQAAYTASSLPRKSTYYSDTNESVQVARQTLRLGREPLESAACIDAYLLGVPGLVFYTRAQVDLVCRSVAITPNASRSVDWPNQGLCFRGHFLGFEIGHACLWLTLGDAILGPLNATEVITLSYAYTEMRYDKWLWFKFGYRILITLFVVYRLWSQYYRHYIALERALRSRGHTRYLAPGCWTYKLVIGDPTAIVLLDPWIAAAFVLDMWFSCSTLAIAVLRASQNADVGVFLLNTLYLSRTVWFAFLALCLVAHGLKRYQKEHLFAEVDPSFVTIAVAVYGPLVTWLNGNVGVLAQLYQWFITLSVPEAITGQVNEAVFGSAFYSSGLACLPVLYGFVVPAVCHRTHGRQRRLRHRNYSTHRYNDVKNRCLLSCLPSLRQGSPSLARGGSVYALQALNARYKSCAAISLRGADCYLLCYKDGVLIENIRLSLLQSLQLHPSNAVLAVHASNDVSPYVVNVLVVPHDIAMGPHTIASVSARRFELQRPAVASAWCM